MGLIILHMTSPESYYDWELNIKPRSPSLRKKKRNKKEQTDLGISVEAFRRFIKLWKSKNIAF